MFRRVKPRCSRASERQRVWHLPDFRWCEQTIPAQDSSAGFCTFVCAGRNVARPYDRGRGDHNPVRRTSCSGNRPMKPLINITISLKPLRLFHADKFSAKLLPDCLQDRRQKLGYNLTVSARPVRLRFVSIPITMKSCFYVIEVPQVCVSGRTRYDVRPGDVVACPLRRSREAHQFVNTGRRRSRVLWRAGTTLSATFTSIPILENLAPQGGHCGNTWPPEAGFSIKVLR